MKEELLALKEKIKTEVKAELKQEKKEKKKKKDKVEVTQGGLYYTKKEPRKSFSTFIRNQNKFYVNNFNVVDRKAAIMIRVNAMIISAIVLLFQYLQDVQYGTFIALVMVTFSFISMMLAINASKPDIFSLKKFYEKKVESNYPKIEQNLFALGRHGDVSLEEYEAAYSALLQSQELQIGNQVRVMYALEQQFRRTFFLIEFSYGAFIIGFTITVIAFIVGVLQTGGIF